MTNLIKIETINNQNVVDSRLIANEMEVQHESTMSLLSKHQITIEQHFGHLRFEIGTVQNSVGAVNEIKYAYLTEDQATFLLTLTRNNQKVIQLKAKLVKAFSEAKKQLADKPVNSLKEDIDLTEYALEKVFGNIGLDKNLLAGIKLNAVQAIAPHIADKIEPARQALIGATESEVSTVTVTTIGKMMDPPMSGRQVNSLLIELDYQELNPNYNGKKDAKYIAVGKGLDYSKLVLSSGKGKDSTIYNQLRWKTSLVPVLDDELINLNQQKIVDSYSKEAKDYPSEEN